MSLKKVELRNPNSCLNKADTNEPIFVLRANDEIAPRIVRRWASAYLESKGRDVTDAQVAKYREALQLADQMALWKQMSEEDNRDE